ncbi:unnamed protein product [Durusdinium trenchii]|uniref:EF-hand domain-containing protein n=1 Tax=Durusdinium trenchii TaxID=1381693 RepID=A0ABP0IHU8_9DINO
MSASASSWMRFWEGGGDNSNGSKNGRKSPAGPKATIHSDFIRSTPHQNSSLALEASLRNSIRRRAKRIVTNPYITQFMAFVVLFDAYCNWSDIDARAQEERPPEILQIGSVVCLSLYTIEVILLTVGQGRSVLKDSMFILDLCVIVCGFLEMILDSVASDLAARVSILSILRLLRLGRVVRLVRLFGKIRALRELQKLVTMISTCLKALAWSFVFCFIVMTIWAMLLVELVHPLIQELNANTSVFADCNQCLRATSSVMHANLLLFKTVIAGDSWGKIAVPVIEAHPATAIIFVGSLLTIVFGVLNLIVAVVVDTFADARDRDVLNLAEEMEQDLAHDKTYLERMFKRIDLKDAGKLSLDQLVQGARNDAEFQSRLRVMDIDEMDLVQLFEMIDTDGSGFIEPNEFIRPLSRWVHDSKTAPRFIKYNMMRAMAQQEEIKEEQSELRRCIEKNFIELARRIDKLHPTNSSNFADKGSGKFDSLSVLSDEEVEPVRSSQKVTLQKLADSEADLEDAVKRLEDLVLHATVSALKDPTDLLEGGHWEKTVKFATEHLPEELEAREAFCAVSNFPSGPSGLPFQNAKTAKALNRQNMPEHIT